uniref:Uncharacterized protein n=1 Tax=Megaselia scalaris TaxID=36166 RepID=T1GXS8_MEGSC
MNEDARSPGAGSTPGPLSQQAPVLDTSDPEYTIIQSSSGSSFNFDNYQPCNRNGNRKFVVKLTLMSEQTAE